MKYKYLNSIKTVFVLAIVLFFTGSSRAASLDEPPEFTPQLQTVLDDLQAWTIIVYDLKDKTYQGLHSKYWSQPSLPASTFKVPHALIGLETQAITPESIFPWNGQQNTLKSWNQDHNLASAIQVSCVPCFQQLARKIGVARMHTHLKKLHFGQMNVSPNNLDKFWLEGNSYITPRQQVHFMQRLAERSLPIQIQHQNAVANMMQDAEIPGLFAKTGWASIPRNIPDNRISEQEHFGWYVGYYQHNDNTFAFAVRLLGKNPLPKDFSVTRKNLLLEYLKYKQILTP